MPNRREFMKQAGLGLAATAVAPSAWTQAQETVAKRPNVLLILVDDMGWSDIGCYGGEVDTPNLDYLANQGIRFTQFHNTAKCFPSRACLPRLWVNSETCGPLAHSSLQRVTAFPPSRCRRSNLSAE